MAFGKPTTVEDIAKSYARAIKKMQKPYSNVVKYPPAMRGQQVPPGRFMPPPAAPSVAFNVNLRGK